MTTKYIIGLDGGSQSSKVVIFDTDGHVVCDSSEPLAPMHTPGAGIAEHPHDDLYDSMVAAASRAMKSFPGNPADIIGVGLCTIRCCRALVRSDGTLAGPVQSWMDHRLSTAYEHENDDVAFVTTASGYLMGRLTGELTDTAANYIGPWPMDVRTWNWFDDQEKFDSFKVPRDMLYRLQMPGDVGGFVNTTFSRRTGIPQGIPVVHTANDKAAEALGAGLRDDSTGLISLGTYIAGMVVGKEFAPEPRTYFSNFASEPYRYIYECAGIRRGMWTVSWLRDLLGAENARAAAAAGASAEELLNKLASDIPAGSDGLLCVLDWLAPPNKPFKKGMFIGFDERHGYAHMYRAVLEGIAFTMKRNMAAMTAERDISLRTLVVSGGGSNSDLVMQIFADVFNIPVVRNVVRNAAGLGAAVCVAVACGIYPDFDEAAAHMVRREDRFEPDPRNAALYERLCTVSAEIPMQTDPILEKIHKILSNN